MNLLGISWGMGARDVGMKAAVTGAQGNLDKLNSTLEQQSKIAGKSKGPGFWAKMKQGVRDFNIASIASDVHALTGDTGNLTTSLEAMGVANAKAAKPFVASLNLTNKEMRRMTSRISGMAIGMNVGAEAVAEVFKSMEQATGPAKEALDALGYSQKDWVKISETTGIKVAEMTDAFGGMGALWKAAPKDEAIFLNRLVEIGKKAGLGVQPVKNLKQSLEEIGNPFEKLPPEMQRTGAEMMGLVESSARLGGVFREMGSSEEEATTLGVQTAKMFGEQAVAIERAQKYGLNALDESPLFKWLTSLGVGYAEATNIVETGSRDAVKGTQMIQDQFKRFGMGGAQQQAMLSELSSALGESAAGLGYLAQNTDTGAKALARMNALTITGKDSLKKYADSAFSSGRTLQESFDLAKEGFDLQIRSISRKDVIGLVSSKMGAFREVGKEMKDLAKEGGPLSMLIRGMSTFKQMGIQGVFLQVGKAMGMDVKAAQKLSIKFGLGFETLQGFAQELGPLVNMLGQFGPMGIAAGGIVGFFMLDDADRQKILGTLAPIWEKIKKTASDIWYGTDGKTGLSDWLANSWETFKGYVQSKWPEWKQTIKGVFAWVINELGPAVIEGMKTIGGAIVDNLSGSSLAIGGIITTAILGAKVFGAGPIGIAATFAAALTTGLLAFISDAETKLDEFEQKMRGITKDTAVRRRGSAADTMSEYKERSKEYGMRGEKVTSEGIADKYASGDLGFYDVDEYTKGLKFTQGMSDVGRSQVSKLQMEIARQEAIAQGLGVDKAGAIKYQVVDKLSKQMEILQQLPEVQERLYKAREGGVGDLAREMRDIGAEYAPIMNTTVPAMLDQAEAVRLAIAELEAAGSTEWSDSNFGPTDDWLVVDQLLAAKAESDQFSAGAYTAGEQVIAGQAAGVSETMPILEDAVNAATQFVSDTATAHSPIVSGPLAGVGAGGEGDPAFVAGRTLMESFALGIDASALFVAEAVTRVLDDSVLATFDAYKTKMDELAKKKPMLAGIADAMVRDFGGSIQSTITIEGQKENVKANLQAMLSIPGIAGVVAAVVSEGAKSRAILDKIRDNTQKIAESDLVAKGKSGGASYTLGG